MAWSTPYTSWAAGAVPSSTDFNRIENNIVELHKGNGQPSLQTIAATTTPNYLDLPNATDESFIVAITDYAYYAYIETTGRAAGNRIQLICQGASDVSIGFYSMKTEAAPDGYAKIRIAGQANNTGIAWTAFPSCVIQFVYDGTYWVSTLLVGGTI